MEKVQMIPDWYLTLTAIFFTIGIVVLVAILALIFRLLKSINAIEPQVNTLMTQVNGEVLPKVSNLADRVDALATSVEKLSTSTLGITESARETVHGIGSRAMSIGDTLASVATAGISKLEKAAPVIGLVLTGLKIFQSVVSAHKELTGSTSKAAQKELKENGKIPVKK